MPNQFQIDQGANTISPDTVEITNFISGLLPTAGESGVPDQLAAPMQCGTYLSGVRSNVIYGSYQRPLIRVTDGSLQVMGELTGELSCSVEDIVDDTGKCSITILFDNWLVDWMTNQTQVIADLNIIIDPYPSNPNWKTRWGGKITEIHVKHDDQGIYKVELVCLHFREHAKKLLIAANPVFPPEVQLPRMWVCPGPVRTICALTAFINLGRLFFPTWSFITNIFNPAGWINPLGPDAALNLVPTEWPIQVAFVDPALDQSRWSCVGAAWSDWHSSFKDLLVDAGCVMRVYTYLTTDADSPNTELVDLLSTGDLLRDFGIDNPHNKAVTELCAPQRNCVVFSFENKSGVTGPTGTAADGLTDTIAVTLDDLITPVLIDLKTGNTYDPGQVIDGDEMLQASGISNTMVVEQLLDVAPGPPQCIWWDGTYNGMVNTDNVWHKGGVKTIMTGSKSPTIVNEAQTFAIKYGLSQLQTVLTTGLFESTGTAPLGAGLDSLYQGQLDNVLFAWERFTDPVRALYSGDVAWQEHFEKGSGTAYTLASIITLRSGDWKTRAWNTFTANVHNAWPWVADYDYYLGDRVGFEANGIVWVDNVYSIKRQWDWHQVIDVQIKIGDDRLVADPFGLAFKTMATMYAFVSELAGEGTLFG